MLANRLCSISDCKKWIQLNRDFMNEEIQDEGLWNDTNKVGDEAFRQTFEEAIKSKDLISLMMFESESETIGFANLMTVFSVWTHGKALVIDDLFICREQRGKGYGRQALMLIENYAKATGHKRIQFQSELTNPNAMKFYMAVGYTPADMKFYVKYFDGR